jgi:type VI secretion system Hcp family effector
LNALVEMTAPQALGESVDQRDKEMIMTSNTNNSATIENRQLTHDELNAASGGTIFVIHREVDTASPLLWQALCTNEQITSVVLSFARPGL